MTTFRQTAIKALSSRLLEIQEKAHTILALSGQIETSDEIILPVIGLTAEDKAKFLEHLLSVQKSIGDLLTYADSITK